MYKQGDIYYADLNPVIGNEQSGNRPVLIISGNSFNSNGNILIVIPITSKIKNFFGDLILEPSKLNGLKEKSEILIFHIRSISTNRIKNKIGEINETQIKNIINGLNILLNNI